MLLIEVKNNIMTGIWNEMTNFERYNYLFDHIRMQPDGQHHFPIFKKSYGEVVGEPYASNKSYEIDLTYDLVMQILDFAIKMENNKAFW